MATPPSTVPSWDDNDSRSTAPPSQVQDDGLAETQLLPNVYLNWVLRWLCAWAQMLSTLGIANFDAEHDSAGAHTDITADSAVVSGTVTTARGGTSAAQVGGSKTSATADGSDVTNTTAETVLHNTVLLTDDLQAGVRVHMRSVVKVTGYASGTLTIRGRIDGVSGVLCWSFAVPAPAAGSFLVVDWFLTCRTDGATGTVESNHTLIEKTSTTVTPDAGHALPGGTVDTTGSLSMVLTAQWSVASASNVVATEHVSVDLGGRV